MTKFFWTKHAKAKMRYWSLSEPRVKRVLRAPSRTEEGIATDTIAVLQVAGSKSHPYEVWVMAITDKKTKRVKIISAWRYPGRTKPGEPLPKEILREFTEAL